MAWYKVKITETYKRTMEVEADNEDEAYDLIDNQVDCKNLIIMCKCIE